MSSENDEIMIPIERLEKIIELEGPSSLWKKRLERN